MNEKVGPLGNKPGIGGIAIDSNGAQGTVGFWEFPEASSNSWLGKLRLTFGETMKIAQRHHLQNREVLLAKVANKTPKVPEVGVRQTLARQEQKRLDELDRAVGQIADETFLAKAKLKPYDYEKGGMIGALNRQELRNHLRGMDDKARREALLKPVYRAAALEQPGEISGVPASTLDQLREEELQAKYPGIVQGVEEAKEAIELLLTSLATARKAVHNELIASGAATAIPAESPEPPAWA
jgi:hypothetical protein